MFPPGVEPRGNTRQDIDFTRHCDMKAKSDLW
jgi:hypothetical protein